MLFGRHRTLEISRRTVRAERSEGESAETPAGCWLKRSRAQAYVSARSFPCASPCQAVCKQPDGVEAQVRSAASTCSAAPANDESCYLLPAATVFWHPTVRSAVLG